MNKTNSTQGVMINVQRDAEQFLSQEVSGLVITYNEFYNGIKDDIENMAQIEELILQQRCIQTDNLKIKLSFLREYVYARCPFYRRDKATKDIRVIVSRIDSIYPDNQNPSLGELYKDDLFMSKANDKLISTMTEEFTKKSTAFWNEIEF